MVMVEKDPVTPYPNLRCFSPALLVWAALKFACEKFSIEVPVMPPLKTPMLAKLVSRFLPRYNYLNG